MQLAKSDVNTIISRVWSELSQISVQAVDSQRAQQLDLDQAYTARLAVSGSWEGVAILHCSSKLTSQAAAHMLGIPLEDVTEQDSQEVLLEILNIISGNLLQVLPSGCDILLPEILPDFDRTQLLAALEVRPQETYSFERFPDGVLFSLVGCQEEKKAA